MKKIKPKKTRIPVQMPPMRLHTVTLNLLKNRPVTMHLSKVAEETGLSKSWIEQFLYTNSNHGSNVNFVEKLYEYLSGKSLNI